jgi:hypothetical protein
MRILLLIGFSFALAAAPAAAQLRSSLDGASAADGQNEGQLLPQQPQTPLEINPAGRTARSSVGQVGQRQTSDTAARAGIKPMARIANRVQNRVQNRIRNRIDRYYDPQANATDPFFIAGERARTSEHPR